MSSSSRGVVVGVSALLVVQNTLHALLLSYSRLRTGQPYLGTVIVVLSEAIKLVANLLFNLGIFGAAATRAELHRVYVAEARRLWVYAVPALLYTVQNNLSIVGATNLSLVQYQITNQLRIPATALVSVVLLPGQRISAKRWAAVVILTVGVVLVALKPDAPGKPAAQQESAGSASDGRRAALEPHAWPHGAASACPARARSRALVTPPGSASRRREERGEPNRPMAVACLTRQATV